MNNKINLYRRNGKIIYIKMPGFSELSFVEELWGNRKNMGDFGEVYSFPKEKWEMFYKKMVYPTDGKNFYCLIYDLNDNPVGEVSFHGYNSATKVARINIKIHYKYRRRGYGEEALRLLLEYYFFEFCGETIIDSVKTEEGKSLLNKIGFEEINNFKKQATYKMTKKKFLRSKNNNKTTVILLAYDNINLSEYSLIFEIFSKANEVLKEDYFKVYSVSKNNTVNTKNTNIFVNNTLDDDINSPDILIIPGVEEIEEININEEIIEYISNVYNHCDYIVTLSNGICILNSCINLGNLFIPNSKYVIEGANKVNKDFIDNGKIMISNNLIGNIELCINIVKKMVGQEIAEKLSKYIGY